MSEKDLKKVEIKTMYESTEVSLVKETKLVKFYASERDNMCLVTDANNNVLSVIRADCAQNEGFLSIE